MTIYAGLDVSDKQTHVCVEFREFRGQEFRGQGWTAPLR